MDEAEIGLESTDLLNAANRYRNRTSVDRQSEERDASCQSTAVVEPSSATESHTTVTTTSYQTTSRILPCDEPSTTEVTLELSPATASTTTTSTTTSSRSFLQDRTPIRGVQDILGRMKAGPETSNQLDVLQCTPVPVGVIYTHRIFLSRTHRMAKQPTPK